MSYPGTLGLAQPAAQRVFQRDTRTGGAFGLGVGAVTLAISPSAPVSLLEYQLRDASAPSSVLVPWTIAGADLASGSQAVSLLLPAKAVWYLVDLRANGDCPA